MSNGKLLTLFLDYENELRATMPDFAHQLSALLNVPPKAVDYSKKAVAAYEDFNLGDEEEIEEKVDEEVDELLSEETMDFHNDFEKNIMFLMDKSDTALESVFKNHFDHDANRDTMIAQLADNFSTEELQNQFQGADNIDLLSTYIKKCGVEPNKKKQKDKLHDLTIDTNIETHCGVERKKKKKNQLIEMQYCESCDVAHADHFRFCDLCNEEHDGCCDVIA